MAVVKLTTANFDQEVLQADRPVLVDFYADWCGPCKMMGPVVEEISGELDDVKVCKINIDEEMEVAQRYGVMRCFATTVRPEVSRSRRFVQRKIKGLFCCS